MPPKSNPGDHGSYHPGPVGGNQYVNSHDLVAADPTMARRMLGLAEKVASCYIANMMIDKTGKGVACLLRRSWQQGSTMVDGKINASGKWWCTVVVKIMLQEIGG